eukprot:scaffold40339_cov68-Phaeocystis_antarctica.AAC.3
MPRATPHADHLATTAHSAHAPLSTQQDYPARETPGKCQVHMGVCLRADHSGSYAVISSAEEFLAACGDHMR